MANSINANALRKSLKTLGAELASIDGFKDKAKTRIKISIDADLIERFTKQAEKFPYEVRRAFNTTLKIIANDLWAALDEAMEANIWKWNDDTRDIIDTGDLRDSGKVYIDGDDIVITYKEEYAAIVHYGGYVKSGLNPEISIYYPARPWIEAVLTGKYGVTAFDFNKALEETFFSILAQEVFDGIL